MASVAKNQSTSRRLSLFRSGLKRVQGAANADGMRKTYDMINMHGRSKLS